jgi:hypothetical protein
MPGASDPPELLDVSVVETDLDDHPERANPTLT